jgi:hypothetical protein
MFMRIPDVLSSHRLGLRSHILPLLSACVAWVVIVAPAHALPSFARQTGAACEDCHIGGFGPQLTPFGMKFKLEGYTQTGGTGTGSNIPLSAMLQSSYQKEKTAPADGSRQKETLFAQQASLFLGGRLTDHLGAFLQTTETGEPGSPNTDHLSMDNTDIRYVHPVTLGSNSGVVGVSLNNNPTVTDVLNTVPAWRFNYISPTLSGGAPYSLMIDGGLAQSVWGLNVYTYLNSSWYAEVGSYQGLTQGTLVHANNAFSTDPYNKLSGSNPYWRLAYMDTEGPRFWSAGLFGIDASFKPDGINTDKYRDVGVDATYQRQLANNNIFALNAAYMYEKQSLGAASLGLNPLINGSSNPNDNLRRFDLSASYHINQTYGLTGSLFHVSGSADAAQYGTAADGVTASTPDTTGYVLQADWTPFGKHGSWGEPWANLRLGLQYTWYTKYNGGSSYATTDVNGNTVSRNASDNNILYAFVWTSF